MAIRSTHLPARFLCATALGVSMLSALSACKRAEPPPKPRPAAVAPAAPAAPVRTREQAIAALMALPELKAWADQIEKDSHGRAHGAVIEDDPTPRTIAGKAYYQLSFVEDTKQAVHRRTSFLVAQQGDEILVEDGASDSLLSLSEWRRNIRRVDIKGS